MGWLKNSQIPQVILHRLTDDKYTSSEEVFLTNYEESAVLNGHLQTKLVCYWPSMGATFCGPIRKDLRITVQLALKI